MPLIHHIKDDNKSENIFSSNNNTEKKIKYKLKDNIDEKRKIRNDNNFFRKVTKKKIIKKSGNILGLSYNFSSNSSENSIIPRDKISIFSTKNNNNDNNNKY